MAEPGEAIYVDIDDINSGQTSATTYTRGSGDSFVRSGTISGGGGGGYKHTSTAAEKAAVAQAAAEKAAEEQAAKAKAQAAAKERARLQQELAAKRAAASLRLQEESKIIEATSFQEKMRLAREAIEQKKAIVEQARIEKERKDILKAGGKVDMIKSIDAETREALEITTTKVGNDGRRIFEVKNLETGETTIKTYDKKGRRTIQTGGLFFKEIEKESEDIKDTKDISFNIETPDRTGQIYDKNSNMFIASAYGMGAGGTAIMTPPTPIEQAKIDAASYKGSFVGLKETYEEKVVIPISKSKYFKAYKEKIVQPLSEKIVQPSGIKIKEGLKLYEEKVVRPIREQFPSLGDTPVGQIAEAKRYIEKLQPDKKIVVGLPGQRRVVTAGDYQNKGLFDFSKQVYLGEVETAFTDIAKKTGVKNPEAYGKGVKLTTEFGAYALPGYFAGEVGISATEASLGGRFGGAKNIYEFVKEKPIEVALVGGLGIFSGVKYFKPAAKEARLTKKYSKYLEAERVQTTIEPEYKRVESTIDVWGKQIKKSEIDKKSVLESATQVTDKTKGTVKIITEKPTGKLTGEVEETVKGGWFAKDKTYKGIIEGTEDALKETIKYPKGIEKITRLSKTGEGSVSIIKKGKLVKRISFVGEDIPKSEFKSLSKEPVKKVTTKKIGDEKISEYESAKVFEKQEGLDVIKLKMDKKIPDKKIVSGFAEKKSVGDIKYRIDKKAGTTELLETSDKTYDIIKSTAKKEVESVKGGDFAYIKKTETSPKIIQAGDEVVINLDSTLFTRLKGVETLVKTTSPDIQRLVAQQQKWKLTTSYGKDVPKPVVKKSKPIWSDETLAKNADELKTLKLEDAKSKIAETEDGGRAKLIFDESKEKIKEILYVPRTEKYIQDTPLLNPELPTLPSSINIPKVTKNYIPINIASGKVIGIGKADKKITNIITTKPEVMSINDFSMTGIDKDIMQSTKAEQLSILKPSSKSATKQSAKTKIIQKEATEQAQQQMGKTKQMTEELFKTKQAQQLRQVSDKIFEKAKLQTPKQPTLTPRIPKIPIKITSIPKRILKKVETTPEIFEAFVFKGDKKISIAKGTKKKVEEKLSKKLKGELAASGFITKGGKKLKASETGLLKDIEFRVGKKDIYKVVEKKAKRLRKSGTGQLIQPFRKNPTKTSKNKWLLGI